MNRIRVTPSVLREASSDLNGVSASVRNIGNEVQHAISRAPSYDGQFGPKLQSISVEATAHAQSHANRLLERSEELNVIAEAFENADRVSARSLNALWLSVIPVLRWPLWIKFPEIPNWIWELIIGLFPLGDLYDIGKELVRWIREGETDELVLLLSVLGLVADIGWVDGPIPDPVDGANGGLALLKALVKQIPSGPARDAIGDVVARLMKNLDEAPRFFEALFLLLRNDEIFTAFKESPRALAAALEAGPEVIEQLAKNEEIVHLLLKHEDDAVFLIKNSDALDVLIRNGPEAFDAVRKAARAGEAALEAVDAALELRKVGLHADEASELVRKITHLSTNGSGDRVVLGRFFREGEGFGYIQEAVEKGGIYYDTPAGVWDAFGGNRDLAWAVNEQFLRDQLEAGVARIDFVGETIEEARRAFNTFRWREISFLDEHAASYGYKLIGNSWIKIP